MAFLSCDSAITLATRNGQSHIEWFKIGVSTADRVVQSWSSWMQRANPYDRRGRLKAFWREIIHFLGKYEIYITAELMLQIQEVEEGSIDVAKFIDDDELRKQDEHKSNQDHLDEHWGTSSSLKPAEAEPAAEMNHEVKSTPIKVEIAEFPNASNKTGPLDIVAPTK
ncbi:hypothetical protein A1O7_02125 [Cladophialophora yegresii CBS 114405]|uniref:Uncharacterized protein n=1 Tax=Cladophialophora yegresii CBS 114405 TaxID=1182544 RepID=W9WAY1_9EURO|nr:uncharacterized protein A1O7_02125 [Cladophialophora yegresii CBS 114405]EXJ61696.1 hypothetical protein A1O7_02125 [Cladophialophora yegresii CBS 114405]